jgi:hypothetical protein
MGAKANTTCSPDPIIVPDVSSLPEIHSVRGVSDLPEISRIPDVSDLPKITDLDESEISLMGEAGKAVRNTFVHCREVLETPSPSREIQNIS